MAKTRRKRLQPSISAASFTSLTDLPGGQNNQKAKARYGWKSNEYLRQQGGVREPQPG